MQSQKSHRPGQKPRRGSYSSDSEHEHGNGGQKVYPPQPAVCPAGIGYSNEPVQPIIINTNQPPNNPVICPPYKGAENQSVICPPYKGAENQPVVCPIGNAGNQPIASQESGPFLICGTGYEMNYPPLAGPYPSTCFPIPGVNIPDGSHYPAKPGTFPSGGAPYPTHGSPQTDIYPNNELSNQHRTEEHGMYNNYTGYQDHSQTNYTPGIIPNSNYSTCPTLSNSQSDYNPGSASNYQPGVPRF